MYSQWVSGWRAMVRPMRLHCYAKQGGHGDYCLKRKTATFLWQSQIVKVVVLYASVCFADFAGVDKTLMLRDFKDHQSLLCKVHLKTFLIQQCVCLFHCNLLASVETRHMMTLDPNTCLEVSKFKVMLLQLTFVMSNHHIFVCLFLRISW